ncbi:hypothetical protein GCK32_015491 [Trichostrongylus colubriformis]|uniref:Uncharacterized protein n=1 Tax=Trichostrongylus colubriformis TaxID=6319 RepID=A0AAN8INJ9_TRICO
MSMGSYLRSLLLFIFFGLSVALPLLWLDNEGRDNVEPQLMYVRNIGPLSLLKRNIAIGRGDGLRPGK